MTGRPPVAPEIRFFNYVEITEGCWEWRGGKDKDGYGKFSGDAQHRHLRAHRFAYELMVAPIPVGLVIDHLCRNRSCVNPDHLEPVTPRENAMRGITPAAANTAKTRCPSGHEYSGDNLYISKAGTRVCRTCQRKHRREFAARKRAA